MKFFNKATKKAGLKLRGLSTKDISVVSGGCTESAGVCVDKGGGHIVCSGAAIFASK
jgi:hypothetical protein